MKKLFMACSVAALAIVGASCSKSTDNATGEDKAFADSIAQYMGAVQGADLGRSYAMLDSAQKAGMSKDAILAGIKTVLLADTADKGFVVGLGIGQGLLQQASYAEQSGIKLNRQKLFENFAKNFKPDSVADIAADRQVLQGLMGQVQVKAMEAQRKAEEARRAEAAQSPEAKANVEAGAAYAKKMQADDPAYKSTESGLVYKVVAAGNGEQPKQGDTVSVKYTGKHIDGSEFDSSGDQAVEFPVNGVVPGFAEALKMMKKGAKYTVIIPGNLAYGADGTPDGSIKPNETLVFDIELVDIKAAK